MHGPKGILAYVVCVLRIGNRRGTAIIVCLESGVPVLSGEHGKIKAMARQRGELDPVGDAVSGLDGPVQALRKAPARRGFTLADQVHQLVAASEADPDLGFMARTMALCSLPLLQVPCW